VTYRWLTDLDQALAPIDYVEVPATPIDPTGAATWRQRGRPYSTGDFDPTGVVCHHTASPAGTSARSDLNVILAGNGDAPGPISQLYVSREPVLYLVAAGRANHAGSGIRPGIDSGCCDQNARNLGIEVANNGVGEVWPDAQTELYADVVAALCEFYGWADCIYLHATTGPPSGGCNSKIDPAGPWQRQPHLVGSTTWDLDVWKAFVDEHRAGTPEPAPEPGDDDMGMGYVETDDGVKGCFFRDPDTGRLVKIWEGHACWSPAEGAAFYAWPRPRVSRESFDAVDIYQP
jgi:hypothetical protein